MIDSLKKSLRQEAIQKLNGLSPSYRAEASQSAAAKITQSPAWANARTIMLFVSTFMEIDTTPLIESALNSGHRLCLPLVTDVQGRMEARQVSSWDQLETGAFGIRQPIDNQCPSVSWQELDLILVPGLLFDRFGHRMGRGAGFYDRTLAQLDRMRTCCIGYFFSIQEHPQLPTEPHDQPLDWIFTETETLTFT